MHLLEYRQVMVRESLSFPDYGIRTFTLYALPRRPIAYPAVIAHAPLHLLAQLMPLVAQRLGEDSSRHAMTSVGGHERVKDKHHHDALHRLLARAEYEPKPRGLDVVVATSTRHHAVPTRTTAELQSRHFLAFSMRDALAPVDENYRMTGDAPSIDGLLRGVDAMLRFRGAVLPWEIAEINGLASRLKASGHVARAAAVLGRGAEDYPYFRQFHQALYSASRSARTQEPQR